MGVFGGIRGRLGGIWGIRGHRNHYVFHSEHGTTDPYYNIKNEKGGRDQTQQLLEFYPHAALLEFYPSAFSSRMLLVSVLPCAVVKINLYCAPDWPVRCEFNFI